MDFCHFVVSCGIQLHSPTDGRLSEVLLKRNLMMQSAFVSRLVSSWSVYLPVSLVLEKLSEYALVNRGGYSSDEKEPHAYQSIVAKLQT